jgi:hypothetical protein
MKWKRKHSRRWESQKHTSEVSTTKTELASPTATARHLSAAETNEPIEPDSLLDHPNQDSSPKLRRNRKIRLWAIFIKRARQSQT